MGANIQQGISGGGAIAAGLAMGTPVGWIGAGVAALALAVGAINTSTSWEENWNNLKNLPADQQLAYYITNVQNGRLDTGFLNQWSELFGNKADKGANPAGGRSQVSRLSYDVAKAYNDLYMNVFPTDPSINENLIDLTKTIQPPVTSALTSLFGNSTTTTAGSKTNTYIIIAIVIIAIIVLIKIFK